MNRFAYTTSRSCVSSPNNWTELYIIQTRCYLKFNQCLMLTRTLEVCYLSENFKNVRVNSTYHFKRLLMKYGSQEKPDLNWNSSMKGIKYSMIYSNLESEITVTTNAILNRKPNRLRHPCSTSFTIRHCSISNTKKQAIWLRTVLPTRRLFPEREQYETKEKERAQHLETTEQQPAD